MRTNAAVARALLVSWARQCACNLAEHTFRIVSPRRGGERSSRKKHSADVTSPRAKSHVARLTISRNLNSEAFSYYRRLRRLHSHVQANLDRRISAQEAADVVGLETHYFSSWFRERAGVTFSEWLADLRLRRAEDLFRNHNYTVLEVALEVGFGSEDSFRRACKRHRGTTPTELKARLRGGGGDRSHLTLSPRAELRKGSSRDDLRRVQMPRGARLAAPHPVQLARGSQRRLKRVSVAIVGAVDPKVSVQAREEKLLRRVRGLIGEATLGFSAAPV